MATIGCLRAAYRDRGPGGPHQPSRFWLVLTALMLLLGFNKQLDLQSLVTVVGRRVLRDWGLYGRRRTFQLAFILAVSIACAGLLAGLLWAGRRSPGRRGLALVGMVFVIGFVIIRAASFHHVDVLLAATLGGLKWNWILELGGIAAVAAGAFRRGHDSLTSGPAGPRPQSPGGDDPPSRDDR
jgi:hypothetical protein